MSFVKCIFMVFLLQGVLSLPIVFSRCGVVFTTISMMFSAYITYLSLGKHLQLNPLCCISFVVNQNIPYHVYHLEKVMLCYSSRRRGGSSYGEIMRSAFGERMEEAVSWLLFVFLMFVIIGMQKALRHCYHEINELSYICCHRIYGSDSRHLDSFGVAYSIGFDIGIKRWRLCTHGLCSTSHAVCIPTITSCS